MANVVCIAHRTIYFCLAGDRREVLVARWMAHCGACNLEQDKLKPHGLEMTCSDDPQRFSQDFPLGPQAETKRSEYQSSVRGRKTLTAKSKLHV